MKTIKIITISLFSILIVFLLAFNLEAQNNEGSDIIETAEKQQVVDSIAKFMTEMYVFPDKGKEMGELVSKNLQAGNYDNISDPREFAEQLSQDLQTVNNDKHIGVRYMPERIAMINKAEEDEDNKDLEELEKKQRESSNYNFKEVKILPGNVGYLKFNSFMDASVAGPTAVAAMNFLAHTDALIIDLRDNGGGSPSLIQLITTYFFDYPEHLNSFYIREGDKMEQFWTLSYVPGERLLETDLYILTSAYTFSGAEEFTYNLKNMKRATVVGETTGGGAHPVAGHIINDNFMVRVPFGKAVNPITNDNWEGTGIAPHVKTTKAKAMETAYLLALDSLMMKEEDKDVKNTLAWASDGLKAKLETYAIDEKEMKQYVGVYGPRTIFMEDGNLYYQREDRPKMQMIPMKEGLFMFNEVDYFRVKFINEGGKIIALEGNYDNGKKDKNDKT